MLSVFTDVVLPVFIIAGLGRLLAHRRPIEIPSLSAVVLYLFGPALVFQSLAGTELSPSMGLRIGAVFVTGWLAMVLVGAAWSGGRGHDRSMRAGFVLAMSSPNGGNMGLPVAALAFGDLGLQVAVVNFVIGAVFANSAGIAIASSAGGVSRAALTAPLRFPYIYAAALGLAVNATNVDLPVAVTSSAETLGGAAIPVMLVVLGVQLRSPATSADLGDLFAVVGGRLIAAPAVTFAMATLVGLDGVERGTLTVLAGMPVAVITTLLAAEFRARSDFVTRTVIVSTVLSMVTLTLLISLVR